MPVTDFVHLHAHSSYSLLYGAMDIATLAKRAARDRMAALALTDRNNLFGALEFSEKLWSSGVQPVVGIDLTVDFADREAGRFQRGQREAGRAQIVLLALDEAGYRNLLALSSRAFLESDPASGPSVDLDWLVGRTDGLFLLTGGAPGVLDRMLGEGNEALAAARLERLLNLFGDRVAVEIQRDAGPGPVEGGLLDLAAARGLAVVASNPPLFADPSDQEAHEALLALAGGRVLSDRDRQTVPAERAFLGRDAMAALFADLPEAVANTAGVARLCRFRPATRKPILPRFAADGDEGALLAREAEEGLARRLATRGAAPGVDEAAYRERLAFEIGVINRMNYAGYFLIVADFIRHAKSIGVPVGPGRGSGAGSLVAYALTITDIDPLRFGLLFERFLNPDRVSMPDFDIDFCQDRRGEVIDYVVGKYGADRVAQIITFGSFLARGVMRDVGRVLEIPYGQVDRLTKLVPQNPAKPVKLAEAIAGEPRLSEAAGADPSVERLLAIAQKLEGLFRHASTHAAGVVIGDRTLSELVPLYRDPRSQMPVTQFNMKWVEMAGLVKFDFLGLKTLTVIEKAIAMLRRRGVAIDLDALPLDDAETYAMLSRGETVGVFQVESAGMRRALLDMKPDRLEDIIALVALYRPGPMANIPVYCRRKHGDEAVEYPHPALSGVLEETFGVIVYQEQVMEIARRLAGYTLGEADLLRRAMGKKIKAEMDAQRARFVEGACAGGLGRGEADEIFDLLARFADYGFNKSHAAAYALVSYQTAYLKARHPAEFLAASMSLETGNLEKLSEFRREAERLGIVIDPPSINRSGVDFTADGARIVYALAAIRGIGHEAAREIVAERDRGGPFASLGDLARRLPARLLNKRLCESLAASGALDALGVDRARAFAGADRIVAAAAAAEREREAGQSGLFRTDAPEDVRLPACDPWSREARLSQEFEALGAYLSGHPLDDYGQGLTRLRILDHATFVRSLRQGASAGRLAATVVDRVERRTKTGSKMGIVTLSDRSGQYEVLLFSELLAQHRDLFEPGAVVVVSVLGQIEGEEVRLRLQSAEPIEEALRRAGSGLRVHVAEAKAVGHLGERLGRGGDGEVSLVVLDAEAGVEVEVRLPRRYDLSTAVVAALKAAPGVLAVERS
jgi:DNA polymerase-3 subunit alpha